MTYAHKIIHINKIFKVNNIRFFLGKVIAISEPNYIANIYIPTKGNVNRMFNHHLLLPY